MSGGSAGTRRFRVPDHGVTYSAWVFKRTGTDLASLCGMEITKQIQLAIVPLCVGLSLAVPLGCGPQDPGFESASAVSTLPPRGLIDQAVGPRVGRWLNQRSIQGTKHCRGCAPGNAVKQGATPDDPRDDDAIKINEALAKHRVVFLPPGVYHTRTRIRLPKQGSGLYGRGAHIKSTAHHAIEVHKSNFFLRGLTIESKSTEFAGGAAPTCISAMNRDRATLIDNTFRRCRVVLRARFAAVGGPDIGSGGPREVRIERNLFVGDLGYWSLAAPTIQNDLITIRGFKDVHIKRNVFRAKNFLRLLKLGDIERAPERFTGNYRITPFHTTDVLFENNKIDIKSAIGRQMIDIFDGTEGFTFRHNEVVSAVNFNLILENKTGKDTNFVQNTVVEHNKITSDGQILKFQGGVGLKRVKVGEDPETREPKFKPFHEVGDGIENVIVRNNLFRCNDCPKGQIISDFRYFHDVLVEDNTFEFLGSSPVGAPFRFYSNEQATVRRNDFRAGDLLIGNTHTSSQGNEYLGTTGSVGVRRNHFQDGAVKCRGGVVDRVSFSSNTGALNNCE